VEAKNLGLHAEITANQSKQDSARNRRSRGSRLGV
jgi:hypothetical protein